MSFDPLSALFDLGKVAIEKVWPDPTQRAAEMRKLEELRQSGNLAQLQAHITLVQGQLGINKVEAAHPSIFVAGWRPFVGWVGGLSLAYVGILEPIMRFFALMLGYTGEFPVIETEGTITILIGMLGIGTQRSFDKAKGTHTSNVGK
tara:strand:+ start:493 stop:933 length:441 start_codon:yes stop_codon:yes gene_type:complete